MDGRVAADKGREGKLDAGRPSAEARADDGNAGA